MYRFAYLLSLPLALSTGCFNPSGGGATNDTSTGSDASSTVTLGSTTAPTTGPTTSSTGDTTQSSTVSSTDPDTTTLPGTTDLITTTDLTGTTLVTDTTGITTLQSTGIVPMCGNGELEDGEECDDGNIADDDDCSNACTKPKCGDGVVHVPTEECDDGNAENTDACVAGCKDAKCGDDFVRAGVEVCDDGNTNPGDGCGADCLPENLLVFVSSGTKSASMLAPDAADSYCNSIGQAAFPGRTFVAWISTAAAPVKNRLGPNKGREYVLPFNNKPVAVSRDLLLSGTLDNAIQVTEKNEPIVPGPETEPCSANSNYVWTGTNVDGTGTQSDCVNWSTNGMGAMGTVGSVAEKDHKWTNRCMRPCSEMYRVYCIQKEI